MSKILIFDFKCLVLRNFDLFHLQVLPLRHNLASTYGVLPPENKKLIKVSTK